jgi:hypothetical protein
MRRVYKAYAREESVGVGRPMQTRFIRPAPGVKVVVLAALCIGLIRPTPLRKVLVLSAL